MHPPKLVVVSPMQMFYGRSMGPFRRRKLIVEGLLVLIFGVIGNNSQEQGCFDFSSTESVAGNDFEYLPPGAQANANGSTLVTAETGQLIDLKCASVICPAPQVQDCFYNPSVCSDSEWCLVDTEIMWGPWAMGNNGETPGANGRAGFQCETALASGMQWWWEQVCSKNASWGPWSSMRGRCVPYRQEQQSCQEQLATNTAIYGPNYPVRKNGKPFARGLLCRPDLICTGEVGPFEHTCVKKRPPNVCYIGPWWDSSWCKVGGGAGAEYETGLPQDVLEEAAAALLVQLPQEKLVPSQPEFWYSAVGNTTRNNIQNIVQSLWPEIYRNTTKFPLPYPDPRRTGPPYTEAWNSTAARVLTIQAQTPKVWSTVHSLITNTKEIMDESQVQASQALAMFLAQSFICPDCRGYWRVDVLDEIGLPPSSNNREDHIYWWWMAHNMVSEHTAATRGGHPWVYPHLNDAQFKKYFGKPANNTNLLKCQNPFFLPYEDAVRMWKIE